MALPEQPPRHLLDIQSLSDDDLTWLIARAQALAAGQTPSKIDRTVVNLFFEPSTRTRVSFELAALRLNMRVISVERERSSSTKGESLEDTAANLAAMGVDGLIIRHPETGRCHSLAGELASPVQLLNAGDGSGHHPSQALLDVATLASAGIALEGAQVAIVGDIVRSRVASSDISAFLRCNVAEIRLSGPESWMPESLPSRVSYYPTIVDAVEGADVIIMLRIQRERMEQGVWPDGDDYHHQWGLRTEHLKIASPGCRVLHPGPINRGVEISNEVADGERSLILQQVRMGVFMRMAIMEWLFGADEVLPRG
ncbi:MAG: aspartate carbamoyltransferase catalytic subunit [Wenzhouxiangella sp.]|jgi:aspartate carbamoyltransferase catalytic subunit|nr:aspartate carbamoyltransferase catalytic subunit [Wenzhouxiangella sp.]